MKQCNNPYISYKSRNFNKSTKMEQKSNTNDVSLEKKIIKLAKQAEKRIDKKPLQGIEKLKEAYELYKIYSPAENHKPLPEKLKEVISKYHKKYP